MALLNTLHQKVLFLGDRPAEKNLHPSVAFVGTKSYLRLLQWIHYMDLDIHEIVLANAYTADGRLNERELQILLRAKPFVVFLGKSAEEAFNKFLYREFFGKPNTFLLPHPSGANRQLNDSTFIQNQLRACSLAIYNKKQAHGIG